MIDERLGRHSVSALTVLIPGLLVAGILSAGQVWPGRSYPTPVRDVALVVPSLLALLLGLVNGDGLLRSAMPAALAGALIVAWYAVLVLPFPALCSAAAGDSCM